ncbi:hypothetical protein C8F01DRAFT_1092704 [Mycena amicta]|nr:hypothetical protein C8F01DRAFT_1092704 [Mycena amicta]
MSPKSTASNQSMSFCSNQRGSGSPSRPTRGSVSQSWAGAAAQRGGRSLRLPTIRGIARRQSRDCGTLNVGRGVTVPKRALSLDVPNLFPQLPIGDPQAQHWKRALSLDVHNLFPQLPIGDRQPQHSGTRNDGSTLRVSITFPPADGYTPLGRGTSSHARRSWRVYREDRQSSRGEASYGRVFTRAGRNARRPQVQAACQGFTGAVQQGYTSVSWAKRAWDYYHALGFTSDKPQSGLALALEAMPKPLPLDLALIPAERLQGRAPDESCLETALHTSGVSVNGYHKTATFEAAVAHYRAAEAKNETEVRRVPRAGRA